MTHRFQGVAVLLVLFSCCCAIAQPQSCAPAPSGLVGWWMGEGNATDVISGNNGTLEDGTTFAPGEVGQAFSFNAGYVDLGNPATLNISGPITIAAWVKPNNNDTFHTIFNQFSGALVIGSTNLRIIGPNSVAPAGAFEFGRIADNSGLVEEIVTQAVAAVNAWQFVVAVYDGANYLLYINGVLDNSTFMIGGYSSPSGPDMQIGADAELLKYSFDGLIDEFEVYNVALSPSQVQAIYNAGSAGMCKGLNFSPTTLKFSRQTVGTTSPTKTVTVTNSFPLPVTVNKITTSLEFAQNSTCPVPPARLATGATCTVSVSFTPTAAGTQTGRLTLTDSAPISPQRVRLLGTATDIGLSVSRLNFGSRRVGTTSPAKTVTVTDEGSVTVNFTGSGITIAGTDPADFIVSVNTCGTSISAGASCTVSVEFKPTSTGTRSAILQLNDDGGASPQTVALLGNGT